MLQRTSRKNSRHSSSNAAPRTTARSYQRGRIRMTTLASVPYGSARQGGGDAKTIIPRRQMGVESLAPHVRVLPTGVVTFQLITKAHGADAQVRRGVMDSQVARSLVQLERTPEERLAVVLDGHHCGRWRRRQGAQCVRIDPDDAIGGAVPDDIAIDRAARTGTTVAATLAVHVGGALFTGKPLRRNDMR